MASLSILRDVLLIVLSLVIPAYLGVTGIFWAAPVADVLAMAVTAVVIRKVWKGLDTGPRLSTNTVPRSAEQSA